MLSDDISALPKKKANFVKATGPFTFFKDTNSFEIGTKYVDDRDKIK